MSAGTRTTIGPTPFEDRHGAAFVSNAVSHNYIRADCQCCGHTYRTRPGKSHAENCPKCTFPVRLTEDANAYALPRATKYLLEDALE